MLNPIFKQSQKYSYRDPAAFYENGRVYLFFSLVENAGDEQYFTVAMSESPDFIHWSPPKILTEKNTAKNFSSPGNVIKYNNEYYLCIQTYPRPNGEKYGNDNSRIYTIKSRDLINWGKPEIIMVKGDIPISDMGRMIDPYILKDNGIFRCFFKQNGVSFSTSADLVHWIYQGNAKCGENVCVIKKDGEYLIFHSPENGIGLIKTYDFKKFEDCGVTYLNQKKWTWAKDRITAGFVLDLTKEKLPFKYAMFFHGDNEDSFLFGASIGIAFGNDLINWEYEYTDTPESP